MTPPERSIDHNRYADEALLEYELRACFRPTMAGKVGQRATHVVFFGFDDNFDGEPL